ncbi:hypothetical protein SS50377_24500 [Spironucleus salmonicida]|uniref:Uncharacterized protein n=1 Tax=Spironucleus salmonicida TaxID=348837 RepID=V6LMP3_9EUKA|nr:hypothetical protein SS50377_24500 [Spironucleus salmonicida]|eukprot:EST45957.1 Hypothetical protein SS50377_13936 [Spironucleus salmonicida]
MNQAISQLQVLLEQKLKLQGVELCVKAREQDQNFWIQIEKESGISNIQKVFEKVEDKLYVTIAQKQTLIIRAFVIQNLIETGDFNKLKTLTKDDSFKMSQELVKLYKDLPQHLSQKIIFKILLGFIQDCKYKSVLDILHNERKSITADRCPNCDVPIYHEQIQIILEQISKGKKNEK